MMRKREQRGRTKGAGPAFFWLRSLSDFLVGSQRMARGFDPESYVNQLARLGFTHVTVNRLADRALESGPPGDVYSWFYDYSPDLDQFVESPLSKGYYPTDYLRANLASLKRTASLALEHGLVPGLHINSPRSMPESFWREYPYLRGARVDHPRESFLPRYTLAMAHPAVQDHYRHLVRALLAEVPQIGFIHVWTNDSGAGFEFTSSLYAGRNGGPYLIREWKSDEEIERKASENVLTYFYLLRDEGQAANKKFRLVCDLGPFYKERPRIIRGLGKGIDAGAFGYFEGPQYKNEERLLAGAGASIHRKIDVSNTNVIGLPFPGLVYDRLAALMKRNERWVLTNPAPESLAPFDVNGEVLRAIQENPKLPLDRILRSAAERWAGPEQGPDLIKAWNYSDAAVRSYPNDIPYSTFAFPWFRLFVRPFVPDINAIPETDREYYEKYLLATFNNPTRVDFNNDMMWNFLSAKEAGNRKNVVDRKVLPFLEKGIVVAGKAIEDGGNKVFDDLEMRLRGAKCFYGTMRNMVAWIEGVHGYIEARTREKKSGYRNMTQDVVERELANTKELLKLWETGKTDWLPISSNGETLHIYGSNFGDLLKKKIGLMEQHSKDEPAIDPNFMWRMHKQ